MVEFTESGLLDFFTSQLQRTLMQRARGGRRVVMFLDQREWLRHIAPAEQILFAGEHGEAAEEVLRSYSRTRFVSLSQVLNAAVRRMSILNAIAPLGDRTLWLVAAFTVRYAGLLLRDIGAYDRDVVNLDRLPDDFDGEFGKLSAGRRRREELIYALIHHALDTARKEGERMKTGFIRFSRSLSSPYIEWLQRPDGDEAVVKESLREFCERLISGGGWERAIEKAGEKEYESQLAERARNVLGELSPRVASAVEESLKAEENVFVPLGTGAVKRSIPMSVWLAVYPAQRESTGGEVVIMANRSHDEFALQDSPPRSGLFYFPPCLLSARLSVDFQGVNVDYFPKVLMPQGGTPWDHPYTGPTHLNPRLKGRWLESGDPAYKQPSPAARARFEMLGKRLSGPMETDLCLENQDNMVGFAIGEFKRQAMKKGTGDILTLVTRLHDILRRGLVWGHCHNDSPPRTNLEATLFPLNRPTPPPWLARRTFPYDPANGFPLLTRPPLR